MQAVRVALLFTLHNEYYIPGKQISAACFWPLHRNPQDVLEYPQALKTPNNMAVATKLSVVPCNRESNNNQTLWKTVDCA